MPSPAPASARPAPIRRARFAVAASADDLERQAWCRAVENIRIEIDVTCRALERFDLMLLELESDVGDACLVIAAPTGAGKSHVLGLLHEHPRLVAFEDDQGPVRPLVALRAPSPCTLKRLAAAIYEELSGEKLPRSVKQHDAWESARQQLLGHGVSVLSIDEAHHMFLGRTRDEVRSLVETLKNLVLPGAAVSGSRGSHQPIGLVLSGMPTVRNVLREDGQLLRRSTSINLSPVGPSEEGFKRLRRFIELVEPRLEFPKRSGLADDDMLARFQIASSGYLGRVMAIIKKAARVAILNGCDRIDRVQHLADVADQMFAVPLKKNPFLVADPASCRPMPQWTGEDRTLMRGKKPVVNDDDA